MPRWNDGLVDAFPVPSDSPQLSLEKLKISEEEVDQRLIRAREHNTNPLRFFDFPAELRNRIYNLVLFSKPDYRGADGKRRGSRIAVLLTSKRFHTEASYALYTTHKFLIFPVQVFDSLPTIRDLPLHYRNLVTNLELVLGESWHAPPKEWKVTKTLTRNLGRLNNIQTLSVFVKVDPCHPIFKHYRKSYDFYTNFCGALLEAVLKAMPQLRYVQFDGYPSVDVRGPLVSRLREEAETQEKIVKYGKEAGWAHKVSEISEADTNVYEDNDYEEL